MQELVAARRPPRRRRSTLAQQIAAHPPVAVRSAKHNINQGITAPGLAGAVEATALLFTTDGHKQRVDAFLDERA